MNPSWSLLQIPNDVGLVRSLWCGFRHEAIFAQSTQGSKWTIQISKLIFHFRTLSFSSCYLSFVVETIISVAHPESCWASLRDPRRGAEAVSRGRTGYVPGRERRTPARSLARIRSPGPGETLDPSLHCVASGRCLETWKASFPRRSWPATVLKQY